MGEIRFSQSEIVKRSLVIRIEFGWIAAANTCDGPRSGTLFDFGDGRFPVGTFPLPITRKANAALDAVVKRDMPAPATLAARLHPRHQDAFCPISASLALASTAS